MKTLKKLICGSLLAVMALTVGSCKNELNFFDQDLAQQTQGTWMQILGTYTNTDFDYSDEEHPATFVFTSDGKFKITFTDSGTSYQSTGNTYEVDGDNLTLNWVGIYPGWSFVGQFYFDLNQMTFNFDIVDTETGELVDSDYTWIFYKHS